MVKLKCNTCGKEIKMGEGTCPDCGSKDIIQIAVRIEFFHPGIPYPFSAHRGMIVGRNHFRGYGDIYRYLEEEQFEVIDDENCWKIRGLPATNPTFLNGSDITGEICELKDGDKIKIGRFEVTIKFVEEKIQLGG